MNQPQQRRRILIVDRSFQHAFMLRFAGAVIGCVVLAFLVLTCYYYLRYSRGDLAMKFFYATGQAGSGLKQATLLEVVWLPLLLSTFLSCLFMLAFGLIYSHRIAGPVYRIKRVLRDLREGNPVEECRLRKRDEFHDLAEEVTQTILWVREKLGQCG